MMYYLDVEFLKSCANKSHYPTDLLPEFAFVGRSNVGKSSLINCLVGRRALAKTGSRPGFTSLINYFIVEKCCYFVDLPGYGFARRSKSEVAKWQVMIEEYLSNRESLTRVFFLVDIRRGVTELEEMFKDWSLQRGIASTLILTKTDKVTPNERRGIVAKSGRLWQRPVLFSTVSKQGYQEIWSSIIAELPLDQRSPRIGRFIDTLSKARHC